MCLLFFFNYTATRTFFVGCLPPSLSQLRAHESATRMSTRCSLVFLSFLFVCSVSARSNSFDPFMVSLFDRIQKEQVRKDVPYRNLRSWQKIKGLYSSEIRLNFHGQFPTSEARRILKIFDNNIFATMWVTSSLIEAFKYGGAQRPTDKQLAMSINAMQNFHNKNKPYNTSITCFWEQRFNKSTNYWESVPLNLVKAFSLLKSLPLHLIEVILKVVGLRDFAKFIEFLIEEGGTLLQVFHIPPDFDDTFVNMALGSLLYQQKDIFPEAWGLWDNSNSNLTSVFDALKYYAYRPFSEDPNLNSIDPRTYYHIRGFLDQAKANGEDIALVPTWVQSIDEARTEFYLGVAMPFWVNNIDVTVAANTIFGITSAVLSGLVSTKILEDPLTAQIYENTSSLIAYEIKTNFSGRPDLALTYYPSQMEFYWFVARTKAALESARNKRPLPVKVMETVYRKLQNVLEHQMTKYILSSAKRKDKNLVYFDDFLGDADLKLSNKSLIRGEDRIFTTAMAANSLLDTWTVYDEDSAKSYWKKETPENVRTTVAGSIKWLRRYTLDGKYEPWNVFFSGSSKGFDTLPFWYPGNRFQYLNGTNISDWSKLPDGPFIYAVQGYVPEDWYNRMLNESHFGYPTPRRFNGYNNNSSAFPFWSSVPYTYSVTLVAVSRFDNTSG